MNSGSNFVQKNMELQEIAVTIAAKNLNPGMLSPDFLKVSGIIPQDWELSRQPVANARVVQLSFKNGVNVVAQPGTVTFAEAIGKKALHEIQALDVACKYVEKLPNADYQGVSINPKSLIGLDGGEDAARKYLVETLVAPGPWQDVGQGNMKANLSFLYQLERCQLNLSITEAKIQQPEKQPISALLFSGSFNYAVANLAASERIAQLTERINNWQMELTTFRDIVNQKFLGQTESVFPESMQLQSL